MRAFAKLVVMLAIVMMPRAAFAQASITGTVKDASGGVMPGVTVEASSDALIEKVRSATTDNTGQYRIVDLRPGIYTVTVSLVGFNTFKREGIELTGTFTATVNADLKVGALEETVTVTGESPIIDTQSVRRQTTLSNDVISSLPAARAYAGIMQLIPSATTQAGNALDIQVTPGMLVFGGAGGRNNEGRIQVDGLNTGAAFNGAGVSSYVPDIGNAQEIAMTTSGGLGEAEVGGPTLSIVPKTGGNTFKGTIYQSNVTDGMVGDNYTQDLKNRGLTTPGRLFKLWDTNIGVGGPIKKDRIWFFGQFRDEGSHRTVPGMFANTNFGDPAKRTYVADRSRPAVSAGSWRNAAVRLTIQATPRNKVNVFWDEQKPCQGAAFPGVDEGCRQSGPNEIICGSPGASNPGCNATNAPETGTYLGSGGQNKGQHVQQVTWTSPVTSRLLLEAGFGTYLSRWGGAEMPGNPSRDIVRVQEQCARGCADNGNIANLTYRSEDWNSHYQGPVSWRASATYVTGARSMKVGYQAGYLIDNRRQFTNNQYLMYRTQNGVPDQLTEMIRNFFFSNRVRYDAFYAQEVWTLGRFTLQGAVRFDRAWSWFPEAQIGGVRFLPSTTVYPETKGVNSYKDITPRAGVAWDVFGTGKTSVKINVGRYLESAQNDNNYIDSRPTGRVRTTTTRTWNDANGNFVPDCDLQNPLAQDLRGAGGDVCAQISDLSFGKAVFDTAQDPALSQGWGVRPGDWQIGASVQQQLLPRVSLEVGYYRRWLQNFVVTDNLAQAPSDLGSFYIVAPSDPRLPNGGAYKISNLYNANQNVASLVDNLITKASNYGDQYQHSNSVVLNVSARPGTRLVFQGGFNLGKGVSDNCAVRAKVPELNGQATIWGNAGRAAVGPPTFTTINATNPWCHVDTGLVKRATGLGSWTIPKIEVQVAGTFRSDQGQALAALYNVPNADIQPILGRPLSNSAPNVTVNLIEPGTLYGDRVNEIDLRIAKIVRVGRTRTNVGVDIYNIINTAAVLTYNQNYNPTGNWLVPTGVLQPRFFKFSATIDF